MFIDYVIKIITRIITIHFIITIETVYSTITSSKYRYDLPTCTGEVTRHIRHYKVAWRVITNYTRDFSFSFVCETINSVEDCINVYV